MSFTRAHLYVPIYGENAALLQFAQIRIYQEDGVTVFPGTLYRDPTTAATFVNPHNVSPVIVDLYLDAPARVVIGYTVDQTQPEQLSEPIDVSPDTGEDVLAPAQLFVTGDLTPLGIFSAVDPATGFWDPIRIEHEHAAVAAHTMLAGDIALPLAQAGTYPGTTVLGAGAGAQSVPGSLVDATMLGWDAQAAAAQGVAVGAGASSVESTVTPWWGAGVALGAQAAAGPYSVAVGQQASALTGRAETQHARGLDATLARLLFGDTLPADPLTVAITAGSTADGTASGAVGVGAHIVAGAQAVALGAGAVAGAAGVALGASTGARSHGATGSVGLGADAQYGLPSDTQNQYPAIMIGAHDPDADVAFSWANPLGSQSESWLDEYLPTMQFTGKTVQIQHHLQWLIDAVALQVGSDATLGGRGGTLGFFGATPAAQQTVGDDEPGSGLPALDSLIFALRDLGLLGYRTEAMMIYRAADLAPGYLDGDQLPAWPEHHGRDLAVSPGAGNPMFTAADVDYADAPTVFFDNGEFGHHAQPLQQFRGANLLGQARHFIVVAQNVGDDLGVHEGLFNLSDPSGQPDAADVVFLADQHDRTSWMSDTWSGYHLDGLNQFGNCHHWLDAEDPHVYRATGKPVWPHARPVLGGPPDSTHQLDSWSGSVAEFVGLDATWDEQHAGWMANGLQFLYGIRQDDDDVTEPAEDFLVAQHNPQREVLIFWKHDDDFYGWGGGRVYGYVQNAPGSVISVPYVEIFETFLIFSYEGPCSGYWSDIDDWEDCEVVLIVREISFDDDDDVDIIIGTYPLNGNGTWTTGRDWCRRGYKRVIVRRKITEEVIVISGTLPLAFNDLAVHVYTRSEGWDEDDDGPLEPEDIVPLQSDMTFNARVRHDGDLVARLYQVSTGTLVATTEDQDPTLPRTTVYASDDPDTSAATVDRASTYESALTVLAFCGMSRHRWWRARRILANLSAVTNTDGSLDSFYSAAQPSSEASTVVQLNGCAWAILAELRYEQVTGDDQFRALATGLGDYLITTQQPNGSLLDADTGLALTAPNAVAYFALRDLGLVTGTTSYTTAANSIKASLLANHWTTTPIPRWLRAPGDDAERLDADVFGGLFLLATGNWDRARDTIRHLRRLRVTGQTISTGHYSGDDGLLGYKPFGELGATPYTDPPALIDQAQTWAALLFKSRYGEPIGEEVASLVRWGDTDIINDPADVLIFPQWLAYSQTVEGAYHLRARPYVGAAAWAALLANGASALLTTDPAALPAVQNLALSSSFDYAATLARFRFTWTLDPGVPAAAMQAIPESSTDGVTWTALSAHSINAQLPAVRDPSITNGYVGSFAVKLPSNLSTLYRVRVRVRNTAFGAWAASAGVPLPTVH